MKNLKKLACALMLFGLVGAVQAASVSLTPLSSQPVTLGSLISFDVMLDFGDAPVTSGDFNLTYDTTRLAFSGFNYGSNTFGVSTFNINPSSPDGEVQGIGFVGSISGSGILGTVTFLTEGLGMADLSPVAASPPGFFNGSSPVVPDYFGNSAQISAVPVPAAVWLMASGLLGMVGLSRRT